MYDISKKKSKKLGMSFKLNCEKVLIVDNFFIIQQRLTSIYKQNLVALLSKNS